MYKLYTVPVCVWIRAKITTYFLLFPSLLLSDESLQRAEPRFKSRANPTAARQTNQLHKLRYATDIQQKVWNGLLRAALRSRNKNILLTKKLLRKIRTVRSVAQEK